MLAWLLTCAAQRVTPRRRLALWRLHPSQRRLPAIRATGRHSRHDFAAGDPIKLTAVQAKPHWLPSDPFLDREIRRPNVPNCDYIAVEKWHRVSSSGSHIMEI